jgi:hypothetical protein
MSSGYRLAPALAARLVGVVLVVVAVLVLVTTVLVAVLAGPLWVVLAVAAVGLAATLATALAVRRVPVLVTGEDGYRVRWVRGAGVRAAGWRDVSDAVAASPGGIDCVVLRLREGGTTSIPVDAVAADRDELVRSIREHLKRGEGLRPL